MPCLLGPENGAWWAAQVADVMTYWASYAACHHKTTEVEDWETN